jgi:hypothetical protein
MDLLVNIFHPKQVCITSKNEIKQHISLDSFDFKI